MENNSKSLKWYHYIAVFFAGLFLTNAIPHFISGIMGNRLPTPFSDPPGVGLSSPVVNVLWGLFNFIVGYILFQISKVNSRNKWALVILFVSVSLMAINLSITFVGKAQG